MTNLRKEPPSQEQMDEYWRRANKCKSIEEILSKGGRVSSMAVHICMAINDGALPDGSR